MVRKVLQRGSPDTQSQTLMPELPDEYYLEEEPSADEAEKNATQLQAFLVSVFKWVNAGLFLIIFSLLNLTIQ